MARPRAGDAQSGKLEVQIVSRGSSSFAFNQRSRGEGKSDKGKKFSELSQVLRQRIQVLLGPNQARKLVKSGLR